jgi:TolA-binding protein
MAVIRIKTDLGISYGLARKKFEEQFNRQKETYARITGKKDDELRQMEQEKELAEIKTRQKNIKEMTERIEKANQELKRLTKGLIEARKTQKELNEELTRLKQTENMRTNTRAIFHGSPRTHTDSLDLLEEMNNTMIVDPFAATKRARSSSEEENSEKGKPQTKRKEIPKEVTMILSDDGGSSGPEEDDYMITVETWKVVILRLVFKINLPAKANEYC